MSRARIARVLVDSPLPQLDRLFDYGIPDGLVDAVVPGVRVRVPLRSAGRVSDGFVVELADAGDYSGPLSEIESVVSPLRVLTEDVWTLARRVSERAAGSAIDIVRLAIPTRQVRVEKAFLARIESAPIRVIEPAAVEHYAPGVVESAITRGERVAVDAVPLVTELSSGITVGAWALTLAQAATHVLAAGRRAILVVPDYRDQDQLQAALEEVLPAECIVRLDARQSNPDRYRGFLRCLGDEPLVVIGNRSAVYAPARDLGLIAVWDDGDALQREPLAPYVHARDAALVRQEQQGCALIMLGHARTTEVERLVEVGWLHEVRPAPSVIPKVVPTAYQSANDPLADRARIPSSAWHAAREALARGPVLVQVARPGYSPQLACAECGQTARCVRCEGPLAQRQSGDVPACAWCGALAIGWRCRHCDADRVRLLGAAGASRTAEDLGRAFPGVRVIIADGERPVQHVDDRPALVIATRGAEPIARGGYRAVLLLDGERMIARESLRVAEDCVRWWSNAIALAARGAPCYLVGIGGELARTLVTWNQAGFARSELADRRRLRFPPAVRVATLTGSIEAVESAVRVSGVDAGDVLGPVDIDSARVRTILRFDYARGSEIAAVLRAEVVRAATSRRRGARGRPGAIPLRVRMDDIEPFLES